MSTRPIHALAVATMAGLVLIGCGKGGDNTSPTAGSSGEAATTTATASTTVSTSVEPTVATAGIPTLESVEPRTEVSTTLAAETTTTEIATTLPVEATNRPAVFADFPLVSLIGPPQTGAGVGPTFEWDAADGAASYRLSVLGPDGPIWLWEGAETSVALALRPDPRPASAPALEIVAGSSWSVAALDAAGDLIAISGSRPVSPAA